MKNLTLTVIFGIVCSLAFAQTPKANSTKKISNDSTTKIPLKQEKVWPVNDSRSKKPNTIIVNPPAAVVTWKKL